MTKYGRNTWDNYLKVHESVLKKYVKHFVSQNVTYKIEKITENYYTMEIERLEIKTHAQNTVWVKIEKDIDVQAGATRKIAKTHAYSYHCWIKNGEKKKDLIRYCGPHLDHNKFHHKHDFTKNPPSVTRIGDDEWPHVSDFFDEVLKSF
jgi:hypothetical protein